MHGLRIKVNSPVLPILTLKLVAIEPSEKRKKGVKSQSKIKYLPCGENLVKIGPVDPEISSLKGLFKSN